MQNISLLSSVKTVKRCMKFHGLSKQARLNFKHDFYLVNLSQINDFHVDICLVLLAINKTKILTKIIIFKLFEELKSEPY